MAGGSAFGFTLGSTLEVWMSWWVAFHPGESRESNLALFVDIILPSFAELNQEVDHGSSRIPVVDVATTSVIC